MATEEEVRRSLLRNQTASSVPQRVQPATAQSLRTAPAAASVPQRVQPASAPSMRTAPAVTSVPVRQGIGAPQMFPSQAEALRAPGGSASVPQRAAVAPMPSPVNTAPAGDATARIGQRLANISGEPYRDPRSVFNRPIDLKPAANAAAKAGSAAKTVGKALIPSAKTLARTGVGVGALVEGSRAGYDMMTPGMTDLDKTARVGEGIGRFGLGTAGALKGAALGSTLGPVGTVVGGIAGGAAGAFAPELVNKAYNAVSGFFGGPGDNQIPSQKAAELREKNGMPPANPVPALPKEVEEATKDPRSFIDDVQVDSLPVTPQEAQALKAEQTARIKARQAGKPVASAQPKSAPTQAGPAMLPDQPAKPAQGIGANPMDGVLFTSLGVEGKDNSKSGAKAFMADGRVLEGSEAIKIIQATDAYNAANPVQGGPVEIIRGGRKTTAVPELGFGEMETPDYQAMAANGGIGRLMEAMAQGGVDSYAPEEAKMRAALAERELANQGGAAQAAISAGPGFARVALERELARQQREDAINGIGARPDANRFTVVPGGQEIIEIGGLPTTVNRPARVFNNQTGQFIDESGMQAVGNYKVGEVYTDANGNKAKWDGRQFVPVK
jgi:hypothetical protein